MPNCRRIRAKPSYAVEELFLGRISKPLASDGNGLFLVNDGPPFANGDLHIGHVFNKLLKDIFLRQEETLGARVKYSPGWDCHGLPIELRVIKSGVSENDASLIRRESKSLALETARRQSDQIRQLGVLTDWENSYRTCDIKFEVVELRAFYEIFRKGLMYRAKKPVYYSVACKTALAEAELEYVDTHKSVSCYVRFPLLGMIETFALVWTTTPWTLPANQALAINKDAVYLKLQNDELNQIFIVGERQLERLKAELGLERFYVVGRITGKELLGLEYTDLFACKEKRPFIDAEHVDSEKGTGKAGFCYA